MTTPVLAAGVQQRLGLAVAIVLLVGWVVYLFTIGRRGYEPGSEIEQAPNRRPYLADEAMEGPRLDRVLSWALGFLVLIAIGLPVYWLREPTRQAGAGFNRGKGWFKSEAVADGKRLFEIFPGDPPTPRRAHFGCAQCHGPKGEGGVATYTLSDPVNRDAPPRQVQWQAPPLNTVMLRYHQDLEKDPDESNAQEVRNIIIYGRANTPMPPWGTKGGGPMNDQQIDDLLVYLKSIQLTPEKAKAQAAQYGTDGSALFDAYCARCHTDGYSYGEPGPPGGGAFGFQISGGRSARQFPAVDKQIEWVGETAEAGKAYGQRGVSHGIMPHFSELLTPEQIRAIVDYERTL